MKQDKVLRLLAPFFVAVVVLFGSLAYLSDNTQAAYVAADSALAPMMVRTSMPVTTITRAGVTQTLSAGNGDGHSFSNDGKVFVIVTTTASRVVTFVTPGTIDGLDIEDLAVTVPTTTMIIGPFPPQFFNQVTGADKGSVYVDLSSATGVTIGAFRLN